MIRLILDEDFMKACFQSIFQQNKPLFFLNKADHRSVISIINHPFHPRNPCSNNSRPLTLDS